uniref:ATP-dependent DNA helicase n=1 Tax=Gouania willdenowi TaxID=441366 RepID=A0A8C5GDZ6_GOUWI
RSFVLSIDVQAELDSVEAELELVELQLSQLLQKQTDLTSLGVASSFCSVSSDFSWSADVQRHLSDSFHLSTFRKLQLRAINLTLSGRDVFVVMPTGGGKSLCYQLPAVLTQGFTLVVTPLVSLMEDQLMALKAVGVPAAMLNASSSKLENKSVLAGMVDPSSAFKLLYVTPEKIAKSKLFMSRLEKAHKAALLSRIAVDEVHCCSQWGHDFRSDYKLLGILKRQFPDVPLIGLTATASTSLLNDCSNILSVREPITVSSSFNRTNLYYEVRLKSSDSDAITDICSLIKNRYNQQSGIVYVFSQKDAALVSAELQKRNITAFPYHANMNPEDKTKVHRRWSSNKIQVVVATVAFGMGIDKPDVRFVIHHTISKSLENYYQESGRAGRDDKPADCIVYFGFSDVFRISSMVVMENVGQKKLHQMVNYCLSLDRCRRSLMASHFDEVWDDEDCGQMCDVCRHPTEVDISTHARQLLQILECASSMDERLTPLKLVEAWLGRGPAKHRKLSHVTTLSRSSAESVVLHLLLQGYLREDFSFTPYTTHFYVKLGRKSSLLKDQSHSVSIKMRTAGGAGPQIPVKRQKFHLKNRDGRISNAVTR